MEEARIKAKLDTANFRGSYCRSELKSEYRKSMRSGDGMNSYGRSHYMKEVELK